MPRFTVLLGLLLVGVGCEVPREPAPVRTMSADVHEIAASTRAFPPDTPNGEVRLATMGTTRLEDGRPVVHVRMTLFNRSTERWSVRPADQRLELPTKEQSFATSTAGEDTVINVAPGATETVELYFPVRPGVSSAKADGPFIVASTVRVGDLPMTQATAFKDEGAASRAR